ncbi:MAG: hypothetical protein GF344_12360 [Chitinivibrionales bacterium]|nr:hypothetical protein [Chitinivibrionales bacterium]MBD3357556.1 hypothetical protein [Chitinivibrionales bacterium]
MDTIELLIARVPDDMTELGDQELTEAVASLEPADLANENGLRFRTMVFPFDVTINSNDIGRVAWKDIATTGWPTGKYIFAIRTVDEFGNGGFAPVTSTFRNPWWAKVLTGR